MDVIDAKLLLVGTARILGFKLELPPLVNEPVEMGNLILNLVKYVMMVTETPMMAAHRIAKCRGTINVQHLLKDYQHVTQNVEMADG